MLNSMVGASILSDADFSRSSFGLASLWMAKPSAPPPHSRFLPPANRDRVCVRRFRWRSVPVFHPSTALVLSPASHHAASPLAAPASSPPSFGKRDCLFLDGPRRRQWFRLVLRSQCPRWQLS